MAVCVLNEGCKLVQITTGQITTTIPSSVTACWSPKGKQIACGDKEGIIRTFGISGNAVDDIPAPANVSNTEGSCTIFYCYFIM